MYKHCHINQSYQSGIVGCDKGKKKQMSVDTVVVVAVAFVVSAVLSAGMGATDCANVYGEVIKMACNKKTR